MLRALKRWLAAVVVLWAVSGGLAFADPVPPGYEPEVQLINQQDFDVKPANSSNAPPVSLKSEQGKPGWLDTPIGDHAKGLALGLLVGAAVGIGIIAVGALIAVSAPVLAVAAGAAVIGGALYGLFTGAKNFNPAECAVMALIGGVSAGVGHGLAAAGITGRALLLGRVGVDIVAGGIANTAGYFFANEHPTAGGAVTAFGVGTVLAGLFMGGGYVLGKVKGALGFGGGVKAGIQDYARQVAVEPVVPVPPVRNVAAVEAQVPTLKPKLAKVPPAVREVFGDAIEHLQAAPQNRQYVKELEEAAVWARRNPTQAEALAGPGDSLDGLIKAVRSAPKPDSALLAQNMEREFGQARPKGYAAHHIVAGNEPDAEGARIILQELGIDINDAVNGVYLPQKPGVGTTEMYHPTLHTEIYYKNVEKYLTRATTKKQALEILRRIADELVAGLFPIK